MLVQTFIRFTEFLLVHFKLFYEQLLVVLNASILLLLLLLLLLHYLLLLPISLHGFLQTSNYLWIGDLWLDLTYFRRFGWKFLFLHQLLLAKLIVLYFHRIVCHSFNTRMFIYMDFIICISLHNIVDKSFSRLVIFHVEKIYLIPWILGRIIDIQTTWNQFFTHMWRFILLNLVLKLRTQNIFNIIVKGLLDLMIRLRPVIWYHILMITIGYMWAWAGLVLSRILTFSWITAVTVGIISIDVVGIVIVIIIVKS